MLTNHAVAAAIYVRISKDSEKLGLGTARQRKDCEELAREKGWTVVEVFKDDDTSASNGKARPAYQRMVRGIEAGQIQGIIVWDVDRLTRTPRELEDVIDWADQHKLQLANVGGVIDLATPQGRMTARVKGAVARHEADQQSRRLKRKLQELAEEGRYVGPRPFGWDWSKNTDGTKGKQLVLNPTEAQIVRDCAARFLLGESIHSLTRDLNERRIPTARGALWRSQNVRKLLMRPMNISIKVHNGVEIPKAEWPPILERGQHERLVSKLTDVGRVTNRGTKVQFLLSGLINCALCGQPMHGARARTQNVHYTLRDGTVKTFERHFPDRYRCHPPGCSKVQQNANKLDTLVTKYILGVLEREGLRILGGDADAAHRAHERVEEIQAKLNIAADGFADGTVTHEQFTRINARLGPQLDEALTDRRRATPTHEFNEMTGTSARQSWTDADLDQRRVVIRGLLDAGLKIVVDKPGRDTAAEAYNPEKVFISLRLSGDEVEI